MAKNPVKEAPGIGDLHHGRHRSAVVEVAMTHLEAWAKPKPTYNKVVL